MEKGKPGHGQTTSHCACDRTVARRLLPQWIREFGSGFDRLGTIPLNGETSLCEAAEDSKYQ